MYPGGHITIKYLYFATSDFFHFFAIRFVVAKQHEE